MWVWQSQAFGGMAKFTIVAGCEAFAKPARPCRKAPAANARVRRSRRVIAVCAASAILKGASALLLLRHTNRCHHPAVFMREDVAMVNEISNGRSAEVHSKRHAGVGTSPSPVRNLDRIEILPVRHRHSVDSQYKEVNLVHVKHVGFHCMVCDGPIFHGSL